MTLTTRGASPGGGPVAAPGAGAAARTGSAGAPSRAPASGYRPRNAVRLMIADAATGAISHGRFDGIAEALAPGDVLVVNVSATVPAALDGVGAEGPVRLHLSSPVAGAVWTVEPRRPLGVGSAPWREFAGGEVELPAGAAAELLARDARSPRLWLAELRGVGDVLAYLRRHGQPIRYAHERRARPLSAYQTVFASTPGSAEMPSAGRPFTARLVARLAATGVVFAPVVLHCGVASFEAGERPDAERYEVGETTARLVNQARAAGRRVVAVGTTAARALETVADSAGVVHPGSGRTELLIGPERGVRAVDGLLTGWHEAGASHRALVEAVAGEELVHRCYAAAEERGYLWHEFGDALLVLAARRGGA
ncbi:MAG TPA: S-adenosylmethionine:tRNA ribosyltransferase-isomerase [Trueperaceae bacterium]